MAHVRKQIRDRIATTLTGLTTTGTSVFPSRPTVGRPIIDSTLPALTIYTTEEETDHEMDTFDGTTRIETRLLTVMIQGYVKDISTLDDTLDTISKEVEIAMAGDETINSLAKASFLNATEISFDAEAAQPHGLLEMTYGVQYRVATTDPETALQ